MQVLSFSLSHNSLMKFKKTGRSLIFLIISLIHYWLGSKKTKKEIQEAALAWMPAEEVMEEIPLRVWKPGDDQLTDHASH